MEDEFMRARLSSGTTWATGITAILLLVVLAASSVPGQQDDEAIVASFKGYIAAFMASYKDNPREDIAKLTGGWVKEHYEPAGDPEIDVQRTGSLVSPYMGICQFTLRRHFTAFHKTKAEAVNDSTFVQSDETLHRHRYAYQDRTWVPTVREHLGVAGDKWYDCNEVIQYGENAGAQNIYGCWELNPN